MKTEKENEQKTFAERLYDHVEEYQVDYGILTEVIALAAILIRAMLSLKNIH